MKIARMKMSKPGVNAVMQNGQDGGLFPLTGTC